MRESAEFAVALERPADVVYFEPLSNPTLDIVDAPAAISVAHAVGAKAVVDLHFVAMIGRAFAEAWRWDEPEFDEIILTGFESSRRHAEE